MSAEFFATIAMGCVIMMVQLTTFAILVQRLNRIDAAIDRYEMAMQSFRESMKESIRSIAISCRR